MAYPKKEYPVPMSAVEARYYVRKMIGEDPGAERTMKQIEKQYSIGYWTLDHFRKGKAKTCDVGLFARIKAAFIDHCNKQAMRLLQEAENAQRKEPNEDVANIQREIEALVARLEAAKSNAKEPIK